MVGQQVFAGEATRLAYMTDEAKEGRNAFLKKRTPNFEKNGFHNNDFIMQKLNFGLLQRDLEHYHCLCLE